jgi:hypothetical protein
MGSGAAPPGSDRKGLHGAGPDETCEGLPTIMWTRARSGDQTGELRGGDAGGTRVRKAEDGCPLACLRTHDNIPGVLRHFLGGSSVEKDGGRKIQ